MEREVGGGIGMGNTCKPMAVSFQCMTKSTTIKKIIIIKKKKESEGQITSEAFSEAAFNRCSCLTVGPLLIDTCRIYLP